MNNELVKREDTTTRRRQGARLKTFVLAAIAFSFVAVVAGCGKTGAYKFSSVYNGGFDPEKIARDHGLSVKPLSGTGGVSNPVYGYAWRKWQGIITSLEVNAWETVPVLWRDAVGKAASGFHDEFPSPDRRQIGEPFAGLLKYNKDHMHGEMHFWLIPHESGKAVSYVIFLREEPLKR